MDAATQSAGARGELTALVRLAIPLCLAHAGQQLMSVVDTAMLGRFADAAQAGGGVGVGLYSAISSLGVGVLLGLEALIPQAVGAGDLPKARSWLRSGYRLAVRLGLVLCAVLAASPLLLDVFGVHPEVREEATRYVWGRVPGLFPTMLFIAGRTYLQARSQTRPIVLAMFVANVLNVPLNYILIFGADGIGVPALGALGAALSSSVVSLVMMVVVVVAARGESADGPRAESKTIVRLGLPIGLHLLAEVGVFALLGLLAGRLGPTSSASHQIALVLTSIPFAISLGLGSAAATRVGRAVGAGDTPRARRAGLLAVGLGLTLMTGVTAIFTFAPTLLTAMFTDDALVARAAVPLLFVAGLFQLSDSAQAVLAGVLRGAGDNRSTFLANLFGHYALGLPIAITLTFALDMGAIGLWWGLFVSLTVVAFVLMGRFLWLSSRPIRPATEAD